MSYALVTGSAKGIGRGIAEELSKRNYNLLLIDMDEKGLNTTANDLQNRYKVTVQILPIDLSSTGAVGKIKAWSQPHHGQLQVVVNNAGFGLNGPFNELPLAEQLNIIDVNIKALVEMSHTFIPVLNKQQKGYLMNLGSNAGYQAVPYLCIYAASKAFIVSFTRGIRYELRNSNVSVTCLTPGSTTSNFMDRARMGEHLRKTAVKYEIPAEEVARLGVKGLFEGKAEVITGFKTKLSTVLSRLAPKSIPEKFGANIFEPKQSPQV
ncbi:MAG: SDR family oxidoreductase [Chitinophagaceae bacterium]|nr:SDR family oxidoreductase [Chitinophagaceae bacterium]